MINDKQKNKQSTNKRTCDQKSWSSHALEGGRFLCGFRVGSSRVGVRREGVWGGGGEGSKQDQPDYLSCCPRWPRIKGGERGGQKDSAASVQLPPQRRQPSRSPHVQIRRRHACVHGATQRERDSAANVHGRRKKKVRPDARRELTAALRFAGASSLVHRPTALSVQPPPCRESRVLTRGQQINPRQRPHAATATLRPTAAAEETRIASSRPPRQSSAHPAHPARKRREMCAIRCGACARTTVCVWSVSVPLPEPAPTWR